LTVDSSHTLKKINLESISLFKKQMKLKNVLPLGWLLIFLNSNVRCLINLIYMTITKIPKHKIISPLNVEFCNFLYICDDVMALTIFRIPTHSFLYFIFKIEIHSSESTCRSWWESTGRWKNCLWSKRFRMLWRMTRSPRHPITTSMSTPEKIKNVFDPILYKNAASVLRVLNTFVTTYLFIISFESICNPWGMFNIKG